MRTPTLDRLAKEGVAFRNCFTTSPVCVASRASLFTGRYPHADCIFTNFDRWSPTWVQSLADRGYHCVSIGKMHVNPYDAPGGFHQRFVVENKDRPLFLDEHERAYYDEWDKALHARRLEKPSRYSRYQSDPEGYRKALGAFVWDLDEDMHSDMFVGDMALWWLKERKSTNPLFLQIGFPGPHPPYDPIPRHVAHYSHVDIPLPQVTADELAAQPRSQAILRANMVRSNYDSVAWVEKPTQEGLLRLRRHYAANVSMIDEKLDEILTLLDSKGYLDNALVIFTSDHADAMGDHGHIQKWTMYDCVTRVPLILWSRNLLSRPGNVDALVQLMDVAPTVLDAAGVTQQVGFEARSLWPLLLNKAPHIRTEVYSELARDHIQTGSEYIVMRRDEEWKLVYYHGEPDGELYHLSSDPGETRNLWNHPDYRDHRDHLIKATTDWSMRGLLQGRLQKTQRPQQPMRID